MNTREAQLCDVGKWHAMRQVRDEAKRQRSERYLFAITILAAFAAMVGAALLIFSTAL